MGPREILVNKYRAHLIVEGIFVFLPSLIVLIFDIMVGTHNFAVRQPGVPGAYIFISISYFVMAITFVATCIAAWNEVTFSPVMIIGCACYITAVCVSTPYAYLKLNGILYQIIGYGVGLIWIIVCIFGLRRFSDDIHATVQNYYNQILAEERERQVKIYREQKRAAQQEKIRRQEEKRKEQERREQEQERRKYYHEKTKGKLTGAEQRIVHNLNATKNARGVKSKRLSNLLVPNKTGGTGTTQLDVLEVNRDGVFIIESKDYNAKIFGKIKDKNWIREDSGEMKPFHNPISQNAGHIRNVKSLLAKNGVADVPFYSIIAFSDRGDISDVDKKFPNGIVCYDQETRDVIVELGKKSRNKISSDDVARIYNLLQPYRFATQAARDKHVKQIEKQYSDNS